MFTLSKESAVRSRRNASKIRSSCSHPQPKYFVSVWRGTEMEVQKVIVPKSNLGALGWFATGLGRILVSVFVPVVTFLVLWQGFLFLRDSKAPQIVLVLVAILWGVGGVAALYTVSNWVVEQLPPEWTRVPAAICLRRPRPGYPGLVPGHPHIPHLGSQLSRRHQLALGWAFQLRLRLYRSNYARGIPQQFIVVGLRYLF